MKKVIIGLVLALVLSLPCVVSAANLKKLEVEGIGELSLNQRKYNLKLTSSFDYANIIAEPINDSITVTGAGKVPMQEGMNTITVTAGDETYTINLNFVKKGKGKPAASDDVKNPETGAFISFAVLGTLVVAGATIVTLKRDKLNRI